MKHLAILLALFVGGCAHGTPSLTPTPPDPTVHLENLTVYGAAGRPLQGATGQLHIELSGGYFVDFYAYAGIDGRLGFVVDNRYANDVALLIIGAEGYQPSIPRQVVIHRSATEMDAVILKLTETKLARLVTRGQFFQLEDGTHWTGIEASDFNLYARFLAGEDIEPILQQRADVGFNLLRVWTAYDLDCCGIGRLFPSEHPDFYSKIPAFLDACARHGLYVELTAFTGPYPMFPDDNAKVAHWDSLIAAVQDSTNVLLELVNEADQPANQTIPLDRLQRPPPPTLASHGSNGSQVWPVQPYWDYATAHFNDASEWPRKVGHNSWEIWSGPTLANENTRAPDHFTSPQQAFDAAAGAALLAAGSDFHSVRGKSSELWDGLELELAQAWVDGAHSVPLECQDAPYVHRADLETAELLRVYQRGNSDGCVVRIRR